METRFCGAGDLANPSNGLCDEYRLSGADSFDELIAAYRQIAANHPGHRCLLSLDDVGQARYTSGHAIDRLNLDDVSGVDPASVPPELFEHGEYQGYLRTKAAFPIRLANVARIAAGQSFSDACDFGLTLDEEALNEWLEAQDDPLSVFDQPVSALVVPVARADEAIAAFPNGYFTSDLDPALNLAVARHFHDAHGYDLIGIGASYLGFWRELPPDDDAVAAIAADLRALYHVPEADWSDFESRFTTAMRGRRHLWLRYTE